MPWTPYFPGDGTEKIECNNESQERVYLICIVMFVLLKSLKGRLVSLNVKLQLVNYFRTKEF